MQCQVSSTFRTDQEARLHDRLTSLAALNLRVMDMEQISPEKILQEYRDTGEAKGECTRRHRLYNKY